MQRPVHVAPETGTSIGQDLGTDQDVEGGAAGLKDASTAVIANMRSCCASLNYLNLEAMATLRPHPTRVRSSGGRRPPSASLTNFCKAVCLAVKASL